jgi:uncharacterized protein YjiS (DUF1127 family)
MAITLDHSTPQRTTGIGAAARAFVLLARRWRRARRDRAALLRMDCRARRDVGVTSADVAQVCRCPWWRWPLT